MTGTQRATDALVGIPPSYTDEDADAYVRIARYDPVLLDAVNGVKRLGGLTALSEDRPMTEVVNGLQPLTRAPEIDPDAAPISQATGDLQEQNRQQIDVDELRSGPFGTAPTDTGATATATAPGTVEPAPVDAAPAADAVTTDAGAAAQNNVSPLPLTFTEQLQAASQARLAERAALAQMLAS